MDDITKVKFARAILHSDKPDELPKHFVDDYDLLCRRWSELLSNKECPRNEWAMLAMVSEVVHRLSLRIEALEGELAGKKPHSLTQEQSDKIDEQAIAHLDLRTKAGRAAKLAGAV